MTSEPIVISHRDGLAFVARVGDHSIVTDQPPSNGGADAGPSPLDLLSAGLGSCIALYVTQFCIARNLPHEGMRVEVTSHKVRDPSRIAEFAVQVVLPEGIPPHYISLIERVARSCPAHNTLERGATVAVQTTMVTASRI